MSYGLGFARTLRTASDDMALKESRTSKIFENFDACNIPSMVPNMLH